MARDLTLFVIARDGIQRYDNERIVVADTRLELARDEALFCRIHGDALTDPGLVLQEFPDGRERVVRCDAYGAPLYWSTRSLIVEAIYWHGETLDIIPRQNLAAAAYLKAMFNGDEREFINNLVALYWH